MSDNAAFVSRSADAGSGLRVAVKDLIDIAGSITTAGCRQVERTAVPAATDAACLAGIMVARERGAAQIVGKTNLHELAFGVTGINPAYGTPVNPLDAARVPGGSSSGSAVAVGSGDADVALGSDTGGSVRIPAACCGVVGLKTTWGRIDVQGCWPLSPFLDTIGPLARSVADIVTAMDLLEPGFAASVARSRTPAVVGRIRPDVDTDPAVDAAVDAALQMSGLDVVELESPWWQLLQEECLTVLLAEAWEGNRHLVEAEQSVVEEATRRRLAAGALVSAPALLEGRRQRARFLAVLAPLFQRVDALVLPSIPGLTPTLVDGPAVALGAFTRPGNLLGTPSLSLPVPVPRSHRRAATAHLPASIQLMALPGNDEQLVRLGAVVEAAASAA